MIVGRTLTSGGRFHIMAQVNGVLMRVGRYHHEVNAALADATKQKAKLGSPYVEVINSGNNWRKRV